jgi:mRNA-degrading endonuclease HigB of HigAB toxin-antitoxin module
MLFFPSKLILLVGYLKIGGNKYRLITSIHFNRGKVYISHALTHAEYDQGRWKK